MSYFFFDEVCLNPAPDHAGGKKLKVCPQNCNSTNGPRSLVFRFWLLNIDRCCGCNRLFFSRQKYPKIS